MISRKLRPEERQRLLAHVASSPRELLLYTLAGRVDFGARQLSRLNLGDVTGDGRTVRLSASLAAAAGMEGCDAGLLALIERYLRKRCNCPHHVLPLRTYSDSHGVERCCACHDDLRLAVNPLFQSRWYCRLSPRQMRHAFTRHRDALALDEELTFESLRLSPFQRGGT